MEGKRGSVMGVNGYPERSYCISKILTYGGGESPHSPSVWKMVTTAVSASPNIPS